MTTWTDTHYRLTAQDRPCISPHKDCVSLHQQGWSAEGRGFCLVLTRAHLDTVRRLLAALEALPLLPREQESDPFTEVSHD